MTTTICHLLRSNLGCSRNDVDAAAKLQGCSIYGVAVDVKGRAAVLHMRGFLEESQGLV
jgi:hypothetical protein